MYETSFVLAFNNNDDTAQQKYIHCVGWVWISITQKLSEQFIEKYQDKVDWAYISYYQKLSWEFICKFYDKLYLDNLIENDNIDNNIRNKLKKLRVFT